MERIIQDKMELAVVAAVIDISEKCGPKSRSKARLNAHDTSFTSLDQKIALTRLRNSTLLNRKTTDKKFGPARRNGVCERDEEERILVAKALKHYNRLKHLDLNF